MAHRGLGQVDKANEHLEKHGKVGIRPIDPLVDALREQTLGERIHLIHGRSAFNAARYKEAVEAFKKAVAANPNSARAHVNLGTALTMVDDAAGAVSHFKTALEHQADNFAANYNLGILAMGEHLYEEAVEYLIAALKKNPKDVFANRQLAKALVSAGREDDAIPQYARVLKMAPDDESSTLSLANLLNRKARYKEAIAVLQLGLDEFPDRPLTLEAMAKILATCPDVKFRNGELAVELAQRAHAASNRWEHLETVALALAEAGRCDEAAEVQKKLIAEAERIKNTVIATRLKAGLMRYEKGSPCRPPIAEDTDIQQSEEKSKPAGVNESKLDAAKQ